MTLTLASVIRATGAHVYRRGSDGRVVRDSLHTADLEREFREVGVDSRTIGAGDLFVALRGERADGRQFVADAFRHGARGCMVSEEMAPADIAAHLEADGGASLPGRVILTVADPLTALGALANDWRRHSTAEIIGITGSIGKTTTKEIVANLLATRWPVYRSAGNLNTEIGLPLVLLGLKPEHRVAVLEMGMYMPGDIAHLARIAEPRIGVVTNVHPVHLERAGSIERIARGKSEMVQHLPADGLAVLNGDNPWTRAMAVSSGTARSLLVGEGQNCHIRAERIESHGLEGTSFDVVAEGEVRRIRTRVPGTHVVLAFLISFAIARELGMTWDEIVRAAGEIQLDARQRILRERNDLLIIDDSYNAAPLSVNAALDLLASTKGPKIAVLGDMLELGPTEEADHHQVGERAAGIVDWLVVRGPRAEWIAEAAERSGLRGHRILRPDSNRAAADAVLELVTGRSPVLASSGVPTMHRPAAGESPLPCTVLVKGSRGMRLEEVVQGLREAL